MWGSFDLVWSTAPMYGVVLRTLAYLIGWKLRPSALLAMLVWAPLLILFLCVAEWPPSPSSIDSILVFVPMNSSPLSPLLFHDLAVHDRQPPHMAFVWGCPMSAFLGIVNLSSQPPLESGIPYLILFFLTLSTFLYLSRGSVGTCVVCNDHFFPFF